MARQLWSRSIANAKDLAGSPLPLKGLSVSEIRILASRCSDRPHAVIILLRGIEL